MSFLNGPRIEVPPPPAPPDTAQIQAGDEQERLAAIRRAIARYRQRPSLIIDPSTSTGSGSGTGVRIE